MCSIVIPAHNEAGVIRKTLNGILHEKTYDRYEIIVVCNGCTDTTEEVVMHAPGNIQCEVIPQANKAAALNAGDACAKHFPRIYLDADVTLSPGAVDLMNEALSGNQALIASPRFRMDYTNASWFVRAYYDVWQQLPYVAHGMVGTGTYALSEEGRQRFGHFPEIIADDGYVRRHFRPEERAVLEDCYAMVKAPKSLAGLIKIKTRSRLGEYELQCKFPELYEQKDKTYGSALFTLLGNIRIWHKIPVYVAINLVTRMRARRQLYKYGFSRWERDETSRTTV